MIKITSFIFVILLSVIVIASCRVTDAVPVDIYAGDFLHMGDKPLAGYTIVWEETGTSYTLDSNGAITLDIPVGSNVTFTLQGDDKYVETQTATSTVPPQGFSGKFNEIVIQSPSIDTFDLLNFVVPHKRNFSQCQVVVTVTSYNKSWYNCPQGWPCVVAT